MDEKDLNRANIDLSKGSEASPKNEIAASSQRFFINGVKLTSVADWKTSIGELECDKEKLRFLPLITYKEGATALIYLPAIGIGAGCFLLVTGNIAGAVIAFTFFFMSSLIFFIINDFKGNIYLKKYKSLSSQTELKVKSNQIVDIPKSSIKNIEIRGKNLIIYQNNPNGNSAKITLRLAESSWEPYKSYLLGLSQ